MVNGSQEFTMLMEHYLIESPDCLKNFLQICPNLKKININCELINKHFSNIVIESDLLMKLKVIKEIHIYDNESHILELLVNKYGTSLEGLSIVWRDISADHLKTCFAHISRFESLESLELLFIWCNIKEPIEECLKLLANKCTKLTELRFKTLSSVISNRLLFALSEFRSLEKLVIDLWFIRENLEGSVECLKHMTRLKYLSITYEELTEDFFENIQSFLPNLQYIDIFSKRFTFDSTETSKEFAESLQTMKSLDRVVNRYYAKEFKYFYHKNRLEFKPRVIYKYTIDSKEYNVI